MTDTSEAPEVPGVDEGPAAVAASAKVDPESLALRAQPARAIRFKRSAVVGIAAAASVGIAATAWVALKPRAFHIMAATTDTAGTATPASDALGALPATYADVPKLGPPLPGDLGRPILERQRSMLTDPGAGDAQRVDQAARTARDRQLAEVQAAQRSALMVPNGERPASAATPLTMVAPPAAPAGDTAKLAIDPEHDPNAQQHKADFVQAEAKGDGANPHALVPPTSPYMLSAGSVIAASLITGLRSDLPGLVIAQVSERVFDSATGQTELIPQGARLIGRYDSVVAYGQKRALVVWQRLILPDGSSLALDNMPATDPAGYAGLADKVDAHGWLLLKGAALSTLLGVGSNLTFTNEGGLAQAIRESTQQSVSRAGDQLTSQTLRVQPTITVRPGAAVRLVVERDLILPPWHG